MKKFGEMFLSIARENRELSARDMCELFEDTSKYVFESREISDSKNSNIIVGAMEKYDFFESLYSNYPLIFVTGPSTRDVNLTISQINTHKIRGANIFVIAEESDILRDAMEKVPDTLYKERYRNGYIVLPETGDELLPTFTSTIVLQLLALKMSIRKMELLNKLEIEDHGVHPDSPKNVSKSITVD